MGRRALIDTSVLIEIERGEAIDFEDVEEVAVSVVTLGELELGVVRAESNDARSRRLRTLIAAREAASPAVIDEAVSSAYARLVANRLDEGRPVGRNDCWIAATALAHGAELWTFDSDFANFTELEVRVLSRG